MVTATIRYGSLPILLLFLTLIYGCGSVDGADGDDNIGIEIQARDAGDEDGAVTITIDVVPGRCQEDGEDGREFDEPYGDAVGLVTFRYLGTDGADNTYRFENYTVDYIPLRSPDGQGGTFLPPDLRSLDRRIASTIVLTRNFTEAERTIFLVPINTKAEYRNRVNRTNRSIFGLYSIKVTFFGKKNRQDFSIESSLEVSLGSYNRCPNEKLPLS
jgi:hypothetical protein